MIKFFRKIRQRLITENNFRKYLLYAIGEIVLVVIGILIALQINTWNQKRIAKEDERKILANLKSEFQQNRKELSGAITMNEKCMETGRFIMNLIGNDIEKIRENLPSDVIDRYNTMKKWGIPEDTYTYIFKKNLFPIIQSIVDEL